MLQEGTDRGPRLAWLVERHVRPIYGLMSGILAEGQARGLLVKGSVDHLTYCLIAAASMPYAVAPEYRLVTGDDPEEPRLVEAHVRLLLRLFEIDA